jgi:UDPglucose--hexose-1-phosphate uridylyltransferase
MNIYRESRTRPDGRELHLYARQPVTAELTPAPERGPGRPHLRWHPLREEWVVYAAHRQTRTFLPPADFDPLRPTTDPAFPTEVPAGNWEVAVFDNLFPALRADAGPPPESIVATAPANGHCEVVVFTQEQTGSLGGLPLQRIELVLAVWAERTAAIGARPEISYVFPFENRGEIVGVTLHHPHGQIYAYPFVPPIAARALAAQHAYLDQQGKGLLETLLDRELADGRRILYEGPHVVAWIPAFARYAYEVWIAPRRAAETLAHLTDPERADMARALKYTLLAYDGLWSMPMPYLLTVHQSPTDGRLHPEAHVHLELYPPLRSQGRLKYLAGTELGAGTFAADTLPEDKAAELRAVPVDLEGGDHG